MARICVSVFFLAVVGFSNALTNLTTAGCADPSGLQQCQSALATQVSTCINRADADGSQVEILACGCTNYVGNYNCYAAHCWNRVNECEYQSYITEYLAECPTAKLPVPYFPTPDNAPDSCSCNIGKVNLAISASILEVGPCSNNADGPDAGANVQEIQGCNCCELSSALSSMYAICPNTDPRLIGLSAIQNIETVTNTPFDSCSSYLSEFNCVSDLGFEEVPGNTFYNPSNLPLTGTATLSNLPGMVTAPASGAVFTYTNGGDSQIYAITAANVKGGGNGGVNGNSPAAATAGASASLGENVIISRGFLVVVCISSLAALL